MPAIAQGNVLAEANRNVEAVRAFEEAIGVDESYLKAHFSLGMLQFRLKDTESCITHFNRCLDIDASHNDARCAPTSAPLYPPSLVRVRSETIRTPRGDPL